MLKEFHLCMISSRLYVSLAKLLFMRKMHKYILLRAFLSGGLNGLSLATDLSKFHGSY